MANYGDVALNLPADWNRNKYTNNIKFVMTTVGHTDGVADAYITKQPDERHQFYWCDFNDKDDVSFASMRGYQFCQKDDWTKHPHLWTFDANGYIAYGELRLMFRPAEVYYRELLEREQSQKRHVSALEAEVADVPEGLIPTDGSGGVLKRKQRASR